jgi:hypothetical protein
VGLQGRSLALKDWRLGRGEEVAKASKSGPSASVSRTLRKPLRVVPVLGLTAPSFPLNTPVSNAVSTRTPVLGANYTR